MLYRKHFFFYKNNFITELHSLYKNFIREWLETRWNIWSCSLIVQVRVVLKMEVWKKTVVLLRWEILQDSLLWSAALIMKISHRKEFLLSLSANALYGFYSLIKSTFVVSKGLLCLYNKQDNTWLLVDMKFLSLVQLDSYRVELSKRNSISTRAHVLFSMYHKWEKDKNPAGRKLYDSAELKER